MVAPLVDGRLPAITCACGHDTGRIGIMEGRSHGTATQLRDTTEERTREAKPKEWGTLQAGEGDAAQKAVAREAVAPGEGAREERKEVTAISRKQGCHN